jgi:hypothetical protein
MPETYKHISNQRHDRYGKTRDRQCWNPKQEYPQGLISKAAGREEQPKQQYADNPELGREDVLHE